MAERRGFRGYCSPNGFGGFQLPIPAQNILYRDYCLKNGLVFKLSMNEIYSPDCVLQLVNLLETLSEVEGILMCSFRMLPNDQKIRDLVFDKLFKHDCELHFVLENLVIRNSRDKAALLQVIELKELVAEAPKTLQTLRSLTQ